MTTRTCQCFSWFLFDFISFLSSIFDLNGESCVKVLFEFTARQLVKIRAHISLPNLAKIQFRKIANIFARKINNFIASYMPVQCSVPWLREKSFLFILLFIRFGFFLSLSLSFHYNRNKAPKHCETILIICWFSLRLSGRHMLCRLLTHHIQFLSGEHDRRIICSVHLLSRTKTVTLSFV